MKHRLAYHFKRGRDGRAGKMAQWVTCLSPQSPLREKGASKYTQGRLLSISTHNLPQRVDNVPARVSLRKAHELSNEQR